MIAVFKTDHGAYVLEIPKYFDLSVLEEVEDFLNLLDDVEEKAIDWSVIPYKPIDELEKFISEVAVEDWVMLGKVFRFLDDFFVKKVAFYYQAPYSYEEVFVVEDIEYDWETNKVKFKYEDKTYELPVFYIDFSLIRRG